MHFAAFLEIVSKSLRMKSLSFPPSLHSEVGLHSVRYRITQVGIWELEEEAEKMDRSTRSLNPWKPRLNSFFVRMLAHGTISLDPRLPGLSWYVWIEKGGCFRAVDP